MSIKVAITALMLLITTIIAIRMEIIPEIEILEVVRGYVILAEFFTMLIATIVAIW